MKVVFAMLVAFSAVQAVRVGHKDAAAACTSSDLALRVLMQNKLEALGVPCEGMCKKMGVYPNCQCPGFAGQPSSSDDGRACIVKYCQDPSSPCPNDAFVTCVKENTKVSALQWDALLELDVTPVQGAKKHTMALATSTHQDSAKACQRRDLALRVLAQHKFEALGVPCEGMCKKMGVYPNCQCPGFAGQPSSSDDGRACIVKYCQDPSSPCPNDAFVTCVSENTKVSALQWSALFELEKAPVKPVKKHVMALAATQKCQAKDVGVRALLQEKARSLGVVCEDMCKQMGEYPNCQCPGFAGQPASSDDNRACIAKYCADPSSPCPNDPFVTCVKENTAVSALQWDALVDHIGQSVQAITRKIHEAKGKGTKGK